MRDRFIIQIEHFSELLEVLKRRGYQILGPRVKQGAMVYDVLQSVNELPLGVTDVQEAGSCRLLHGSHGAFFACRLGMNSWKQFLHPSDVVLCSVVKTNQGLEAVPSSEDAPPLAFMGVRPCELHAISVQDKILLQEEHPDTVYRARREKAFLVAVNCTEPGGTCFCTSMNTGPQATSGFDLALTEMLDRGHHYFLVEAGSSRGAEVLQHIPHGIAGHNAVSLVDRLIADAARRMGRGLDTTGIQELFYERVEHPHWERVASRCLACGNCTLVCPTCFCTTVEEETALGGNVAQRRRKWDSCFSMEFSYIHKGPVRSSASARYRHWITHKFATWIEQFGSSGCVGCGRCITWCPVGIDVTEEIRRLREETVRVAEEMETGHVGDPGGPLGTPVL